MGGPAIPTDQRFVFGDIETLAERIGSQEAVLHHLRMQGQTLVDFVARAAAVDDAIEAALLPDGRAAPDDRDVDRSVGGAADLDFRGDDRKLAACLGVLDDFTDVGRNAMAMDVPPRPQVAQEAPPLVQVKAMPELVVVRPQDLHEAGPAHAVPHLRPEACSAL